MGKENTNITDLLSDEKFQDWILHGRFNEYWEARLAENPELSETITEAKQALFAIEIKKSEVPVYLIDASWDSLRKIILNDDTLKANKDGGRFRVFLRYAAALTLLMVATVILLSYENSYSQTVTYETSFGETKSLILDDGTEVVLNANSSLVAFANWRGKTNRQVSLTKGEAYFHVVKKPKAKRPEFVVHSDGLDITVLGTEFNVRNRRNNTEVALKSGKIRLNTESSGDEFLNPGDVFTFSHESKKLTQSTSSKNHFTWLENKINLDGSTLSDIASLIEDIYGKKVKIENDTLLSRRLAGEIPNDNVDLLLQVIRSTLDAQVELKDDEIIIK